MASHNDLGKYGEDLAREYFLRHGFSVLHNNWKHAAYEIDLIASRGNVLHFIEVKTRSTASFGYPEESVDRKKFRHIQKAAVQFLYLHPQWKQVQYDILSISMNKAAAPDYYYIQDVFLT